MWLPKKLKVLKFTESTETMLLVSVVHKMSQALATETENNACILYTEKKNIENTENLF